MEESKSDSRGDSCAGIVEFEPELGRLGYYWFIIIIVVIIVAVSVSVSVICMLSLVLSNGCFNDALYFMIKVHKTAPTDSLSENRSRQNNEDGLSPSAEALKW